MTIYPIRYVSTLFSKWISLFELKNIFFKTNKIYFKKNRKLFFILKNSLNEKKKHQTSNFIKKKCSL